MRLALCIQGNGENLKTGKVYEVSTAWTCEGHKFVSVPAARWSIPSKSCKDCGHDIQTSFFSSRFVPINDAHITEGEKREESVNA